MFSQMEIPLLASRGDNRFVCVQLMRTHKEKVASVLDMVKFSPGVAKTREDTRIVAHQEPLLE